jgi:hypothetical protein
MSREAIIEDLKLLAPESFVSKYLFDRAPVAFASRDDYVAWKEELSRGIDVDAASITIIGSSAVGISLNPYKNFKSFDDKSDVDVAVISHFHFQTAWRYLRNNGYKRFKLSTKQKNAWEEHERFHVYWGAIASDKLLPLFPFASDWLPALTRASSPLVGDREVKIRIYSDYESLRSYQIRSARKLKDILLVSPHAV